MFRFETAGESHGECLVATLTGLPAGIPISVDAINRELWRRQQGYGRGGRMKIETDQAQIVAGVRHSRTIGSPVAILIQNKDWKNWTEALPVEDIDGGEDKRKPVTRPRPGHADLAGSIKYNFHDARYILERASARETTARVAVGAVAKAFLGQFAIGVLSHVIGVGEARMDRSAEWDELVELSHKTEVLLGCVDEKTEEQMKAVVDQAYRTGDTVGGVFEVIVHGLPPGIGTHVNWDERLDGLLAQALMSLQAVKAVELGRGVTAAESPGSQVHDAIAYATESNEGFTKFRRERNNAGGVEGGMSNGEDVVVRGYLKPISTLRRPLGSVSFETREATKASYERSDVCVVPAAGVAGEAMVALTIARLVLEKFGGDSLNELKRNFQGYTEQIRAY